MLTRDDLDGIEAWLALRLARERLPPVCWATVMRLWLETRMAEPG